MSPDSRQDGWGGRDPRWEGVVTDQVQVPGFHDAVRVLRVTETGDGIPHLFVHGLGGSATNWLDLLVPMAQRGPVLATDLPGFGETPPAGTVSILDHVAFLEALCASLGWDRIVLHGNSLGGLVALLLAGRRPDLVAQLCLVSPAVPTPRRRMLDIPWRTVSRFAPFAIPGLGERLMRRAWETMTPEEILEDTLDFVYSDPDQVRDAYRQVALESFQRAPELPWRTPAFADAARSLVETLILRRDRIFDAVDRIEAPVLVLWGRDDRLVVRSSIDMLTERRPEWRFEILPGVGHVPMVEAADRHLGVLEPWLDATQEPSLSAPLRYGRGTG